MLLLREYAIKHYVFFQYNKMLFFNDDGSCTENTTLDVHFDSGDLQISTVVQSENSVAHVNTGCVFKSGFQQNKPT